MLEGLGPALFSDIGKEIKDLLYKDYRNDADNSTFQAAIVGYSNSRAFDSYLAGLKAQLKNENVTTNINLVSNYKLITTVAVDEPVPRLKTIFRFTAPEPDSGQVELHYKDENIGISTTIGLTANPLVTFSAVVGARFVSLGNELSYNIKTQTLSAINTRVTATGNGLTFCHSLDNSGTIKSSLYYRMNSQKNTAVGSEICWNIPFMHVTVTAGGQHAVNTLTLVKARVDNHGMVGALVQRGLRARSVLTVSGEANLWEIGRSAKMGIALAVL
ncbi:Voltage-dependent anion-selective channel protein 1 [Ranunculus cassubicifolius]